MSFKLVTIQYEEQAQLIVKADTDEIARAHILETLAHIPGLEIISVEEATEEMVKAVVGNLDDTSEERTLN